MNMKPSMNSVGAFILMRPLQSVAIQPNTWKPVGTATAMLAAEIAAGVKEGGIGQVEMFDLVTSEMKAAQCAIEAADGILIGSPTLVGDALPPVYEAMLCLNPVMHRNKFAGAFGSYGWSGEAVHNIYFRLDQLHMNMPLPGLRADWRACARCRAAPGGREG